jgi:YD repeat-containing protein
MTLRDTPRFFQTAPNIAGTRTVSYGLDAAGNKTRLTWPDGYSVSYDYDDLNRIQVVRENGTFVLTTYVHVSPFELKANGLGILVSNAASDAVLAGEASTGDAALNKLIMTRKAR